MVQIRVIITPMGSIGHGSVPIYQNLMASQIFLGASLNLQRVNLVGDDCSAKMVRVKF